MIVAGKYRLDQRLGGGGMAEVFLGTTQGAEGFQRKVAIKRVLPGYSDNPAFAQMFIAEARISSKLVHPNIVSVLDFDRDAENRLFLVMELVEGKDLDALVNTGLLPIPVVIFVIGEVLRGLGFAHDLPTNVTMRGIVHRDVSPHNVLLSWEGAVKVSDFGIAKARSASEATASQYIKGKPAYMSPEQANGQSLDGRSDLFAVGVMLWEMLAGKRLFVAEDTRATLAAVLFGQIPKPRSIRSEIPKDLERVCMKLLERELPARYATAEHALKDLLACEDAPRDGREALVAALAERFPDARLRKSMDRMRTPAPSAAGAQSLSGRNAETRVQSGRGRLIAILLASLVVSIVVAYAIVTAVKKRESEPTGSGSVVATAALDAPMPDAEVASPDASPVAPADAAPQDAAVATEDAGKKDASPIQPAHPAKYGELAVTAFPILTVYVDKKRYGDTPKTIKLPVGKHAVRLKNEEEGIDEKLTITITENQTFKIERIK